MPTSDERPSDTQHASSTPWHDRPRLAPPSIALPVLGMLGGMCGEPVSVVYQDYPSDLVGSLQRLVRGHVPDGRVCEIFRPADLRQLDRIGLEYALVLVYPTPGHLAAGRIAQWQLERGPRSRLPTVLLFGEQPDQESPGAVLRLCIGPTEVARLREFCIGLPQPEPSVRQFLSRPWDSRVSTNFEGLRALFGPSPDPPWVPQSLRSVRILRGLLAGHCLMRRIDVAPRRIDCVTPDLADYAAVRELIHRSRAGFPGEMGDSILAAMIRRANVYLKCREEASCGPEPVLPGRRGIAA